MKKRLVSLVVMLAMLLLCMPVIHAATIVDSGTCGDNVTWTLDDDGTLIISGTGEMTDYGYNGSPFYGRSYIKNAVIENGVTTIGEETFKYCMSLTSISIPNSVISIGNEAFVCCSSLTSISIPDSVTYIGDEAFSFCHLASIIIPNSVTYIGDEAFVCCSSLTSISISNSVTSIGNHAFDGCGSLIEINVDVGNRNYQSIEGVLFNYDKTFLYTYPEGKTNNMYVIPNSVTSIGDEAFVCCSSLTSVTIPNSVSYIGENAFGDCSSLTSISIPNGVTSIGKHTFEGCSSLTSISIPNSVTSIEENAFLCCSSLTSVTIPNSVTSIGDSAFASCNSLTSISIPNSVTSIGENAFLCCSSLTSVTIPNSASYIGDYAFEDCSSLTSIIIPNGVTKICDYTFLSCSSLTSISISNSVTSIGDKAFYECSSLTDVYYSGSVAEWAKIIIGSDNSPLKNATIHYNSNGIPTGIQGNTNSTSKDAPIITSANLAHDGTTYDIFNQAVTIEEDSDITAQIEAIVDSNGCSKVKTYITQGVGQEIDITGICKDIQPGKDFSAGKDIYIVAVDAETGKSTSKKTKLKVSPTSSGKSGTIGAQSGVNGMNFKLGQDTGFIIPDNVPVFGGTELNWTFDFIPVSVEYDKEDNNKINVVFGTNIAKKKGDDDKEHFSDFDFKAYKEGVIKAISKQNRTLKQLRNDFKMTKDIKMNLFGGNLLAGGSGNVENSVDVAGYAEMYYTENGLQLAEGKLCLNVEFTYDYEGQLFIWVVPIYYGFSGGAGVGFEGDMKDVNPISFSPEFTAYITGKVEASISGGVGVAKVATAGMSGVATLNLKKSLQNSYFKADVDGTASFNVKVFGKTVAEKEFASGNYPIYETGNLTGLIKSNDATLSSVDDTSHNYFGFDIDSDKIYPNESREYAENPMEWLGNEPQINLMGVDYTNKNLSKLADNIYTECAPQICEVDGKKVMVMQWDNSDRSDIDRTMLVYSVYDDASGTWSDPTAVYDDGTADFYPCFKDGYLVWQNEKTTLTDDMTLTEIAQKAEICVAKWNGNGFDAPTALTDNDTLDTQPSVTEENGTVHAVWTTNTENDIMGSSGTNAIMQSDFDGTSWSAPTTVKSGLNAITNISTGIADDTFCIAYVTDDDNDFNTINEREIRIIANGAESQLTDNDVLDSNPVFANNMIYYYCGGNIAYSDLSGTDVKTVFDEPKAGLTDTFVLDGNDNGDTAVWWTKAIDGSTEVYSSLYKNGEWSDEIQVTSIGNKAKYPSGILNNDGTMLVAFNNGIAENNDIIKTDLYTISVNPSYDVELSNAYFDENTMKAYATITNKGELKVDSYNIAISGNNEKTVSEPLKAGESAEIEIEYQKPSDFSKRNIELSISLDNAEEYDLTNNSAMLSIGNADIDVENVAVNEDETTVSADISNIGYDNAENVKVQLCDGSATGTVIAEKTLNLAVGANESVEFTIDKSAMSFFDSTKQLYVTAQYSGDEASLGNNDGYVYINSPSGSPDHQTEILNYSEIDGKTVINSIARNNTATAVSCTMYTAVYSSEGTLKACGTVNADIDADNDTGVDITLPCTIETGDTIKTFMWEDQTPLANAAELVIE